MSSLLDQIHENCFYVPKKLSCCHLIVIPILMVLIRGLDYDKNPCRTGGIKWAMSLAN